MSDPIADKRGRQAMQIARSIGYLSAGSGSISLIAMTDPERFPAPEVMLQRLPRGSALIWRAYGENASPSRMRTLAALVRSKGSVLLIAGRPQAGSHIGIDGLHLPERALHRRYENGYVRRAGRSNAHHAVTAACHSEQAILAAAAAGVDAVLISPVFPTKSHPEGKPLGIIRFAHLARRARHLGLTPYALGGIVNEADVRRLRGTGTAGVAGISMLVPKLSR
ncbi:thiamine phosphate synthase [Parvibaculum sp.]|uniref:thiamine phosphate synthase n=2 Tax=Parvibaculum sp. TaxID=2024848 RepID=UPI002FDACE85